MMAADKTSTVAKTTTAKKKTTKKRVTNKAQSNRSKVVALTRAFIKKKTGLVQVKTMTGTRPHVGSGCFAIDDLIGGSLAIDGKSPKCPGFPRRAISEVFGGWSSGKTTACLEAVAECQRKGGMAMFLDYEHALDVGYATSIGVNFHPDKLFFLQPTTFEDGLKSIFYALKGGVDLIVVDSVAAMLPKSQLEKDLDKNATIGALARVMSQNLPKLTVWLNSPKHSSNPEGTAIVLINQTRATISTGPGAKGSSTNTAGGNALKFYVWVRLQFTKVGSEFIERKDKITGKKKRYPYGNHTVVKVVKNKVDGKQGHATDIFIRYGQGVDEAYTLIAAAVTNKVVKKETGGWHTMPNGERFHGREKFRTFLQENPKAFKELRSKVLSIIQATADDGSVEEDFTEDELMAMDFEAAGDDEFGEDDDSNDVVISEEDSDGAVDEDSGEEVEEDD